MGSITPYLVRFRVNITLYLIQIRAKITLYLVEITTNITLYLKLVLAQNRCPTRVTYYVRASH